MPNCFTLTRKVALDKGPVPLQQIDIEMCEHFGVPVHDKYWCFDWYNSIGFNIAMGRSMKQQLEMKGGSANWQYDEDQLAALQWLDDNFTSDAWVEIGKR